VLRAVRFEQRFGFRIGRLTLALIKNAVRINVFKDLSGRRLFLELKFVLREESPIKAIQRMAELELLQFISPEIRLTKDMETLLEEVGKVINWYTLLYIEEPFDPWKVYWHALTSPLSMEALRELARSMVMHDPESRGLTSQRDGLKKLLGTLYKFSGDNHRLYTLLRPYDTETLLYVMAKTQSEKVRRLISGYFTHLRKIRVELRGRDLVNMGFQPGPLFKRILDGLLKARLNGEVNSREEEIRFALENFG